MVFSFFSLLFINIFSCALISITIYNIFCVSSVHASNVFTIGIYDSDYSFFNTYYLEFDFLFFDFYRCFNVYVFYFFNVMAGMCFDFAVYSMYFADYHNFLQLSTLYSSSETMLIRFVTRTVTDTIIQFDCLQDSVYAVPEETTLVFFRVYNTCTYSITCLTVYLIYPSKLIPYIKKIQCFCFDTLIVFSNESIELPILFYVSPTFFMEYPYNGSVFFLYILISMNNS